MEGAEISVVIAAVNGPELLARTLASLDSLPERQKLEIVVVATEAIEPSFQAELRNRQIRVVQGGSLEESIPRLRHRGIQATSAPIVAIIEDHVEVESGWAATILHKMTDSGISAVGGRVESGRGGWLNTGVLLADYARYIGPVAEGPYPDLPGNNVAYRREALLEHADALADGKWESWVNDALAAAGHRLVSTNEMVVRHIKSFSLDEVITQRWHFGRSYAGMRNSDLGPVKRTIYGLGSVVLPMLLTWRATRLILSKNVSRLTVMATWPLVAGYMTIGSIGECVGYLFGPGRSLQRVR
ncbi:MAG: glycosyltransferase [bacterium]